MKYSRLGVLSQFGHDYVASLVFLAFNLVGMFRTPTYSLFRYAIKSTGAIQESGGRDHLILFLGT